MQLSAAFEPQPPSPGSQCPSGSGRPIAFSDLWTHPSKDPERRHPYYVNYVGVKNIVEAALATGCQRVVRVTGLSVGLSELHPLAFLLNFCLSMAIM